ncbi:hypothetical protein Ait01nite_040560 [Actinoplanes italicus]|nr:hypothetical protein Ait01nite_040560 [Actinoplanes italicus]
MLVAALTVTVAGGGLVVAGTSSDAPKPAWAAPSSSVVAAAVAVPPATPASSAPALSLGASALGASDQAKRISQLNAALKSVKGEFSVAVYDRKTGLRYVHRGSVKFDTASIVKVQVLACMLLKAQDAGRGPTSAEMKLAGPMIRLSDNNATTSLYNRIGGRNAVTKCNKRLGLTQTVVNARWGLTKTTAADQIRLLEELVDTKGPLSASSRKTAFTLMNTVNKAQDWGVPVVTRTGEIFTVKNGWDTRTADGGLWAVNTIGRITSKNGRVDVSIAVLTRRNKNMTTGVKLTERIAKLTRQHLRY